MTETSLPWGGTTTGDAGPYSDDNWSDLWQKLFVMDRTSEGVLRGYLNELEVTGTVSPISVNTGAALVDGKFYESDAAESVTVPTPAASTRIDRIVLRKDWSAKTVRITRIEGVEGGGAPSLTQNDGVTWDIPLAQASITTGAAITVTDERDYVRSRISRDLKVAIINVYSFRDDEAVETGNDKARLPIHPELDGYRLAYVRAKVKSAPSGGVVTIQLHNIDNAVDMLSTELTIDDGETSSETAATPAVINSSNWDVDDGDDVRIDIDNANGALGLQVECGFVPRV